MPQIDFFILNSQINFIIFFFLGYFFFLKYILSYIAFMSKINYLLVLTNLSWFENNNTISDDCFSFIETSEYVSMFIDKINSFILKTKKNLYINYNIYLQDYLLIRKTYKHTN